MEENELYLKKINLKNRQREIDKLYEVEGLSDRVLDLQVALNQERNALDISDDNDRVFERFVQ